MPLPCQHCGAPLDKVGPARRRRWRRRRWVAPFRCPRCGWRGRLPVPPP